MLKLNSIWVDQHGKVFRVLCLKDDMVWYAHKETEYSCKIQAFQQRFQPRENNS